MYFHIGGQFVLPVKEVVAILNIEKIVKNNKDFFEIASLSKRLIKLTSREKAKTCIITENKVYLSSISTITLTRRIENLRRV